MPRRIGAGLIEDGQAGPVTGVVALALKIRRKSITRLRKLGGFAAKSMRPHQRGRGLAECTGLHLLPKRHQGSVGIELDVDDDPTSAHRRRPLRASLRLRQTTMMRNRGRQA